MKSYSFRSLNTVSIHAFDKMSREDYPRAISRLLMSFLTFHTAMFLSATESALMTAAFGEHRTRTLRVAGENFGLDNDWISHQAIQLNVRTLTHTPMRHPIWCDHRIILRCNSWHLLLSLTSHYIFNRCSGSSI